MPKQLFCSKQIILEDCNLNGGILVGEDGLIEKILSKGEFDLLDKNKNEINVIHVDGALLPGVVDSHVHVNEPGRTAWEGFLSATHAAAAGGVTTIVDMPLNSIPPTTTVQNLRTKADAAANNIHIDVAFWGGVIPNNENDLQSLVDAGVVGFKCFLCPSGVEEFPHVTEHDLEKACAKLQGTGTVLAFHAELEQEVEKSGKVTDPTEYKTYLETRPPEMELNALSIIKTLVGKYDVRVHIVHLSSAEGVHVVHAMRQSRQRQSSSASSWRSGVTAETCHHYLTLVAENVPSQRTDYKCAPPIRGKENRERLWKHVCAGELDLVVSDHSPCEASLKCSNFLQAWGGISSLQFGINLFWTEARKRGLTLQDLSAFLSAGPARLCGLDLKGALKVGRHADFVVFDPDATTLITTESIHHKNKLTPYLGSTLSGRVLQTYLQGKLIYDGKQQKLINQKCGKLLLNSIF